MSTEQTQTFGGKYALLDLIGTGGMAEVYRAKLLGNEGFEKLIVIKKLLLEHALNKELIQVFIGEARLAALLQHENIAAVYDFGQIDGHYFLAMEYLFGKDLYSVMQRAKEFSGLFEASHALIIASKICEGMDYAHNLEDLQNNPLKIIHRDLTPHNIFITYDGKVKIIDFGIAKAEILDNRTKAGVVKGKLSYMSPEQLRDGIIDLRSDIFLIGILLYEMISKKRMYQGDTAELIRKCISVEYDHLEEVLPGLQPELYSILHKALAKDVALRYQSCAEMEADINSLLFSMSEKPDSKILKESIQKLFVKEYEQDKSIKTGPPLAEKKRLAPAGSEADSDQRNSRHEQTVVYDSLKTSKWNDFGLLGRCCLGFVRWPPWKKLAFFMSLSVIAFVLYVLPAAFIQNGESVAPLPQTDNTSQPIPEELFQAGDTPSVEMLLMQKLYEQAQKALSENRLLEPEQDSAVKYYQEILNINPEDRIALDGLRGIGDRYAVLADTALAEQDFLKAEQLVDTGLLASPEYQRLQALKGHVERNKHSLIEELSEKAKQRLFVDRLTTPTDDSAFVYYSRILEIDPENFLALEGIQKIGERYFFLADQAYRQFDYEKTANLVKRGLDVSPKQAGLLELKRDLRRSKPGAFFKSLGKNIQSLFKEND